VRVSVEGPPAGVVTFLFTDIEGSTRRWESDAGAMRESLLAHDDMLRIAIEGHGGFLFKHTGDGVCAAFSSPRSAVEAAIAAQQRLQLPVRMGIATGEAELRDGDYFGTVVNRVARLMAAGHGGQILAAESTAGLLSGFDLLDLGIHQLRDLSRAERVVQLCHPDLRDDFPPLRTASTVVAHNLPVQLTNFVGRGAQMTDLEKLLVDNRMVTLTGAGGAGKTRLAIEIAARIAAEFRDGLSYVDLAPVTHPGVVPVTVARALGLPDQPGRSTMDTLLRFVRDRQMLVVLDNCEHLLDASAELVVALLGAAPGLTLLATSREPIGAAGEVSWRVPSLSVADEATALFVDRARRARPDFRITNDNTTTVAEICRRLDGMPLAIELAAARVRALSLGEILDGLRDRFQLLTGGARTAVHRQQTLRASVDWSHALLSEPERVVFRRLAVFLGGFDLDAAQAVAGSGDMQRFQVLDFLALLVDKSLVVADNSGGTTRYRLLETVRQYAQEKLGESGEADAARSRHRDFYTALAALLDSPAGTDYERRLEQAETEIDNLRAAFAWSREHSNVALALTLASSLQPLWMARGRIREGWAWFDAVLTDDRAYDLDVPAGVRARALADSALLDTWADAAASMDRAQQALLIARELNDPALLVPALTVGGLIASYSYDADVTRTYFTEALGLARTLDDRWRLSQILALQAAAATVAGDPIAARAAGEEGRDVADAIGDRFYGRQSRTSLGWAQVIQGELAEAVAQFRGLVAEAESAHDLILRSTAHQGLSYALACQGEVSAAQRAAEVTLESATELGEMFVGTGYLALGIAALAAGDAQAAHDAGEAAFQNFTFAQLATVMRSVMAQAAVAGGDLIGARRLADEAVSLATGWHLVVSLTPRARVAIALGEREQAERDIQDALACAGGIGVCLEVPDILECIADLARAAGNHHEAARFFGAASGIRQRMGAIRFKVWDVGYEASVTALRDALSEQEFDSAWAEGAALSIQEAIAYAQRGRGERKRPASGWASLTPTEREVVRLVTEGLGNKGIATRLFVSPRTVQAHLTHVYSKLGMTSRVQLAREAARHT
jgi:predicted ATPase/class 3 adenylate cyclase/DNA-binding CsgD family transcriptional regulator